MLNEMEGKNNIAINIRLHLNHEPYYNNNQDKKCKYKNINGNAFPCKKMFINTENISCQYTSPIIKYLKK